MTRKFNIFYANALGEYFVNYAKKFIDIEKCNIPVTYGWTKYEKREDFVQVHMDTRFVDNIEIKELVVEEVIKNFDKILNFLKRFDYSKIYLYTINVMPGNNMQKYMLVVRFGGLK